MGNAQSIMLQCMYYIDFRQILSHPVPRFSDQDLFMRYHGGGVGHLATWQCSKTLLADKHTFQEDPQDSNEDSDNSAGEGILGEGEEEGNEGNPGEGEEEGNGDDSNGKDDGVREEENNDDIAACYVLTGTHCLAWAQGICGFKGSVVQGFKGSDKVSTTK